MTVLDAYGLVAFLAGERAAAEVEALLRDVHDPPVISSVNLAEVVDVLARGYGQRPEVVAEKLDWLVAASMAVIDADELVGRLAGRIRAERYDRAHAAISLADAFAAATAMVLDQRLATSGPALAAVARAEGVDVVGLPDSAGRLP